MNSYPPELLMQLAPVMFVAGLDIPKPSVPGTPTNNDGDSSLSPSTPRRATTSDQFALLTHRLREALSAQRKPAIWVPEASRKSKTFQVVFVEKTAQFPPRKIPDPTSSQAPRSPLSPLHPSSPLHPDGLVAPIWIRKHTSLVPSVFVLFLRLFENTAPPATPRSPLEPDGPDVIREREEREKEDRLHDTELAREIADRKRATNERGMKLTVVLLASRRMLDDPALDGRLTFIRRSSGLDSRAALFVLSPVSPAELADFVKSIQQALFDPALEYYTSHAKRVRRKRNRHAQVSAGAQYPHGIAPAARALPLRPEGWTVRYEYKMACFAEFRGEEEVALKHYQDAYSTLMGMFGSPAVLPPRTKRWAEAKVLADSINIKICKLFLYNAEHALALSQLNVHVRRFSDLSARVWGIGEETYEYWSWLARQYRVFAELLEQGTHFGLTVPTHLPASSAGGAAASTAGQPQQEVEALQVLGLNPNTALMHPGFYYYVAAECTERRRGRFLTALENESGGVAQAPGFQNEKKVDHLANILELYTKAYELFKKYSAAPMTTQNQMQGRFTLWIAYRIAQTYYESGKYDMSARFFERIARTYSREKWVSVLRPLLATWYACAQQLGDVEMSVRLLVEMIARGHSREPNMQDEEETVAEDLRAILTSTVPSSSEPVIIDLTDSEALLDSSIIFWMSEIKLNERVAFQINLSVPPNVSLTGLPINSLQIFSSDGKSSIIVKHASIEGNKNNIKLESGLVDCIRIGDLALPQDEPKIVDANLRWPAGGSVILAGSISSEVPQEFKFTKAEIGLSEGNWNIRIPFNLDRRRDAKLSSPRWFSANGEGPSSLIPIRRANASSVTIKHRPHQVEVAFSHHSPAYSDESYPISIDVTNHDDRELEFTLDVLLQPGEDDSVNHISIEDEHSSGLIKGISYGVLHPGVTACKTLHLTSTGSGGERMLDVSVQSRTVIPPSEEPSSSIETSEVLQTLVVPVVSPFIISHETTYARCKPSGSAPASLSTFDSGYWDDSEGGRAFVKTTFECMDCEGASSVQIESIKLNPEMNSYSRVANCSLDDDDFPAEFFPGEQFSIICELSLAPPDDFFADPDAVLNKPGQYSISWQRLSATGKPGLLTSTQMTLPPLKPPADGLIALLSAPPLVHLHQPFLLELIVRNHHPTRSACPLVTLDLEATESFVVSGIRSGRLPTLIPGAEEKIMWQMIALDCGPSVPLPKIRLTDRRKVTEANEGDAVNATQREPVVATGDEVHIVDVRWDRRRTDGSYVTLEKAADASDGRGSSQSSDKRFSVAVSPV